VKTTLIKPFKIKTFLPGIFLFLFCFSVVARPTLGPPSVKLKSTISNVAVMQLMDITDSGKLQFKRIKDIYNESAESIVIDGSDELSQQLQLNEQYIVGYVAWYNDKISRKIIPRKGGPVLLSLPGASPAIFKYDAVIEQILNWTVEDSLKSDDKLYQQIMAGLLKTTDEQQLSFFITELLTRHPYLKKPAVESVIESLITSPEVSWQNKALLISLIDAGKGSLNEPWFCEFMVGTLSLAATDIGDNNTQSGLIISLLNNSQTCQIEAPYLPIKRWLNSNHSGVVEAAVSAMRLLDLPLTVKEVERVLKFTLKGENIRFTLNNYLSRLKNELTTL